jgi:uncharacterized membrane protein YjfL (UPF0719 family)
MKKFVLIAALSAFSFNSFAQFSLTCPEIYERIIISKQIKKNKVGNLTNDIGLGGLLIGLSAPTVGLSILAGAVGMSVYIELPSREEKVLVLKEEGSRQLKRLTKNLQKKISSEISPDEVMQIIQEGLESGRYCQNFPDLAKRKEVKRHVSSVLSLKYSNRQ